MDFARIWDQAKDLWSRPVGKWLLSGALVLIAAIAIASYAFTRPQYVTLGTFDPQDATKVAQKLNEAKILYKQTGSGFTFEVPQDDINRARLAMAEINLDPNSTLWAPDQWKDRVSWSNTDFDKRRLWVEQTESNLSRAIKTLSVVDQARVQITVPMDATKPLFKEQEKPPKATVVIMPKRGQQLTNQVVESIMEMVAGAVEGLDADSVVVMDASRSHVVSNDVLQARKNGQQAAAAGGPVANDQLTILKQYQDIFQQQLTERLEKVVGAGNVSVIVTPSINWDRAIIEAQEYKPSGKDNTGVILSQQNEKRNTEGSGATTTQPGASGTTPNAEIGVPAYPGQGTQPAGAMSDAIVKNTVNYLVSQTKTSTERPGGAIEEIAVGIFVNKSSIDADSEQAMKTVVAAAMGSKAKVEVAAMVFAPSLLSDLGKQPETPKTTGTPSWAYMLLAVALTLAAIGFFFVVSRPRKPVLEPVFAGPEAAMMGGIPVSDVELAAAIDAYSSQQQATAAAAAERLDGEHEDLPAMAPEEIALLGDEFLQKLGVDPAKVRMREKVEKIAKANPEAVASLLKTWISDG